MSVNIKWLVLIISFFGIFYASAQQFGVKLGLQLAFGTHSNALGLKANIYYSNKYFQLNAENSARLFSKSYGKRKNFEENRFSLGLVLLAGKNTTDPNFEWNPTLHNTAKDFGLGYAYMWYVDNVGTSQRSGAWSVSAKKFFLYFENDVFGGQAKDRFRSGVLRLVYMDSLWHYEAKCLIWTGETKGSIWNKSPMPGAPNGFRDLRNLPYGKTSHGVFSLGLTRFLPYLNNLTLETNVHACIGIDSEQIRHFIQNKLSHDLIFMPKSYKRNTPHYPRLDENGLPVFTKDQRRKDKLYFQLTMNDFF